MIVNEAEVLAALNSLLPVPLKLIDRLASEINTYDCEEWSKEIGQAIVARLQREHSNK